MLFHFYHYPSVFQLFISNMQVRDKRFLSNSPKGAYRLDNLIPNSRMQSVMRWFAADEGINGKRRNPMVKKVVNMFYPRKNVCFACLYPHKNVFL